MIALYVHIPFCVAKCPYCGFYSTGYDPDTVERYLAALDIECSRYAKELVPENISTVYIGGGTPTMLREEELRVLFSLLERRAGKGVGREITVEVNPGTISPEKLATLRQMGCTRLSIGVQSLFDRVLATLGRIHTAEQARTAMELARQAGFDNVGIDLIYAVPGQSHADWIETVDDVLGFMPEHLSLYALSVEAGTRYARDIREGNLLLPEEDMAAGMYETACDLLVSAGYEQYELSNFARPGFSCMHNRNYWDRGEYLGIGAGAWSFVGNRRWENIADVRAYTKGLAEDVSVVTFDETPDDHQAEAEHILLGLRTAQGVDLVQFGRRFGDGRRDALCRALRADGTRDLFDVRDQRVCLTRRGKMIANEAITRLLT